MLKSVKVRIGCCTKKFPQMINAEKNTGVKLDGKSIWKIHMDFFFENPFFS